jgi:hypothetical protein
MWSSVFHMTTDELIAECNARRIRITRYGVRASDAAALLEIAPRTLRRWLHDEVGPRCVRRQRSVFYPIDELAAYITTLELDDDDEPSGHVRPAAASSGRIDMRAA